MSAPRECDWIKLKRLGRYLVGNTRLVVEFAYQQRLRRISVWTDSDFGGCRRTRKSTSGGVLMLEEHLIKCWSINQAVTALSSGEAEYYAMAKGASIGLGVQGMLKDFGISGSIEIRIDSSAAKGISSRQGVRQSQTHRAMRVVAARKGRRGEDHNYQNTWR